MNYSRSTKYRKKFHKLKLITKLFVIWYAMIASLTILTSETSAYFNTGNTANVTIQAASSWWDGSELMFVEKGAENIKACAPVEISAEIRNVGSDMKTTAVYEVYYVDHGNPKNPHGELVGEGVISPLEHNESTMLVHEVSENGHYMFKAYQVPDYEGTADLEIWSLKIHVNCNAAKNDTNVEEESNDASEDIDEELEEESNEPNNEEEQIEDEIDEHEKIEEEPVNEEEPINDEEDKDEESKGEDDNDDEDEETESDESDLNDSNQENEKVENNDVEEGE